MQLVLLPLSLPSVEDVSHSSHCDLALSHLVTICKLINFKSLLHSDFTHWRSHDSQNITNYRSHLIVTNVSLIVYYHSDVLVTHIVPASKLSIDGSNENRNIINNRHIQILDNRFQRITGVEVKNSGPYMGHRMKRNSFNLSAAIEIHCL